MTWHYIFSIWEIRIYEFVQVLSILILKAKKEDDRKREKKKKIIERNKERKKRAERKTDTENAFQWMRTSSCHQVVFSCPCGKTDGRTTNLGPKKVSSFANLIFQLGTSKYPSVHPSIQRIKKLPQSTSQRKTSY